MLREEVVEPVTTDWASPIVFALKKDGSLRLCIDYRKRNAVTVRDSSSLPRMDECLDSFGEETLFSTFDANSSYRKIGIDEKEREKTVYTRYHVLCNFVRVPFALKSTQVAFQRAMEFISSLVKWKTALVYLKDIVVFSRTVEDLMPHIRQRPTLLVNPGLTIQLKNCPFFPEKID